MEDDADVILRQFRVREILNGEGSWPDHEDGLDVDDPVFIWSRQSTGDE